MTFNKYCYIIILTLLSLKPISAQIDGDSLVLTPGVQSLVEEDGSGTYAASYQFFFTKAQNLGQSSYEELLTLLSKMEQGGYSPYYEFKSLFALLDLAQDKGQFSAEKMSGLIAVLNNLYLGNKAGFESYLKSLSELIGEGILIKGATANVILANADYEIEFNELPEVSENIVEEYVAPVYDAETLKAMANGTYVPPVEEEVAPIDPTTVEMPEMLEELGPVVHLKKGDLMLANFIDTFRIRDTEGYYLLKSGEFKGQNGNATWENRGIEANERYAKLKTFSILAKDVRYEFADSYLVDREKLEEPAIGDLIIELPRSRYDIINFPEFQSYYANNKIKGIGNESLRLVGGIRLRGNEFSTESKFNEPTTVIYEENGVPKFRASSYSFDFDPSGTKLAANNAELSIYQLTDSIHNPIVSFDFDFETKMLSVKSDVRGFEYSPFRSSFFNVEMIGDRVLWNVETDSLDVSIVSAKREVPLIIESKDFYSDYRYDELSQIFDFHPLTLAMQMVNEYSDSFYISEMVDKYGFNENLVKTTMRFLMSYGYVTYEAGIGRVTVLEKSKHAYNAHQQQRSDIGYDYDDMLIPSIIGSSPNATIYFSDSSMTVRGVDEFLVSDSLDVVITPTNGEIRLLQNRGIEFDGSLNAGNFKFNGEKFKFEYDSFQVYLTKIDSIELAVELEPGEREALGNQLINTSGTLKINEPNNKSALRSLPHYPIFTTEEKATVSFDKEEVLDGAYDSTIYFDIPPFSLDSVADADPTKYAFQGTLYSNGILPDIKDDLKVMPDKSLGFLHTTPDSGYSIYGTRARIIGDIQLDKSGITSPGFIEHLNGELFFERATFYLDSLVAEKGLDATFEGKEVEGVAFPQMQIEEYSINYLARMDSMVLNNLNPEKPFRLFNDQASMTGEMVMRSSGFIGAGEMKLEGADLLSDSIAFKTQSFESRNTTFDLRSDQSARPILSSLDVRVNYDLEERKATIEPEIAGTAALEFPFAQFKTSIPSATWDIQESTIIMTKPDSTPIAESFFYSTNTELDSLNFNADAAIYDIDSKELIVKGIPYIKVADALITPQGDSLTILENSRISRLTNAAIVLDTANRFHRMFDAEVEIHSRNRFSGKATYELVNALSDTFAIKFDEFQIIEAANDIPVHTRASGRVTADQEVKVSSGFIFEGDITMSAYKKALELNGAVKLDLAGLSERNIWIEYSSNDSISEVVIPFDDALTNQGQPLNAGIHFDSRGDIYMSFITEKRDYIDYDFFVPKGGDLYFEPSDSSFRIDNPLKRNDPNNHYAGSMFSYNELNQSVSFEGKLDFLGGDRGGNIQAAGKGKGNLDSANYEASSMFALSFGITPEGLGTMGQNLKQMGEQLGVPKALDDRSELIYRVAEFIGDDATKKWDNSYRTVPIPLYTASPNFELQKDIVISDVKLKWSKQNKAFYSEGKIGLSNVSNIDLNMELDGFIEIRKTSEGDIFTLLLEMTDGTWYYFNYDGFTLASFSSNDIFNAQIMSINLGKNKVGSFNPFRATQAEVIEWVADFRKLYYGIDEPYRLLMASESNQRLKKKGTVEGDGF